MTGAADARSGGRRIAVLLEYDGTAYRGSQYQDNGPSIQGELEACIAKLTGETARCAFAGRTDAGVHALGQVAAFDTASRLAAAEFVRGLNHFLPEDIAVRAAGEAPAAFDPRRDAMARTYRYEVDARPERSPLRRNRAWHVGRPLDLAAMRAAARSLAGEHDFAAYAGPYDGSTVRTLDRLDIAERCEGVSIEMKARSFLPHQVRRAVGPLVEVGLGRLSVKALEHWLEEAAPSSAGPSAPPCGLYLVHIKYGGLDFGPHENGRHAWPRTH
jgi:tRNA pseudouridine38-40 synthase